MHTDKMTPKQQEVWQFFVEFHRENHYPPTYREVQRHFGFKSPQAANTHIKALKAKGYLKRTNDADKPARCLVAVSDNPLACCMCGRPFDAPPPAPSRDE